MTPDLDSRRHTGSSGGSEAKLLDRSGLRSVFQGMRVCILVYWHAYHVQDGQSALSQAEGTQVGRSKYPYQTHLVRHYARFPIRDEVRHALLPNGRSRHRHLVHHALDYGVHVALWYVRHVLLALYRRSNLLVIVT